MKRYESDLAYERQKFEKRQKEQEVKESVRRVCLEELQKHTFENVNAGELEEVAEFAARFNYDYNKPQEGQLKDIVGVAIDSARDKSHKNTFKINEPELLVQATEISNSVGGFIKRDQYSIEVGIGADEDDYKKWQESYEEACKVDKELALRHMLPKGEKDDDFIGQFSRESISHSGHWGDLFVSESYSEREPGVPDTALSYLASSDNEPKQSVLVWGTYAKKEDNFDKIGSVEEIMKDLQGQSRWIKIAKGAKAFLKDIKEKEGQEKEGKEQAAKFILDLVGKVGIPHASPDKPIIEEWLGMKIEAIAWHDHTGHVGGAFINNSCILTIPGWGDIDLERPADWPADVRGAAEKIKEAWEKDQPEGVVVPFETKREAEWRLEGFIYDPKNLPKVEDGFWQTSYNEAMLYADESEARFQKLPFDLKEGPEKSGVVSHVLILSGKGVNDFEVGTIAFWPSKRGGFYGEVNGPSNDVYSSPKNVISTYLKEHLEIDPRLLKLEWKPFL